MRLIFVSVLGLVGLAVAGCSNFTKSQEVIPEYPPAYEVNLEFCGAQSCTPYKLRAWGPIGEAKPIKQFSFAMSGSENYNVALSSKGCVDFHPDPKEQQLYDTDKAFRVNPGDKVTVKVTTRKLHNQEIHIYRQLASRQQVALAGYIPCAPVPQN